MNIEQPKVHQGKNIKRFREMLGIKQELLAEKLEITQQAVSKLEGREEIEEEVLQKVAEVLRIPVEAIKSFSEENTISIVANTFSNQDTSIGAIANQYNFNPIEKIVELYERMLKTEQEKNSLLEKLLKDK